MTLVCVSTPCTMSVSGCAIRPVASREVCDRADTSPQKNHKTDIISTMRFVAILAILPTVAFGVTVESLPQSEYADTEVSTNIPFAVSFDTMSRVNFSLSLDASPSNSVEVR